jgi:CPA1 family monovalent cation:H+ antiporter
MLARQPSQAPQRHRTQQPPLIHAPAYETSVRTLMRETRPVTVLAVGGVVATMSCVAIAHALVDGLTWPAAFVLGPVAAAASGAPAQRHTRRRSRHACDDVPL